MFGFFKRSVERTSKHKVERAMQPVIENLEGRQLMSVTLNGSFGVTVNGDEVRMRAKSPVLSKTESVWERVKRHSPASTQQNKRSSRLRNDTPHLPVPMMRPQSVARGLNKLIRSVKGSIQKIGLWINDFGAAIIDGVSGST